jgi:hypothetical protein
VDYTHHHPGEQMGQTLVKENQRALPVALAEPFSNT